MGDTAASSACALDSDYEVSHLAVLGKKLKTRKERGGQMLRGVRTTWLRVDDQGSFVLQGEAAACAGKRRLRRIAALCPPYPTPLNKRHARCQLFDRHIVCSNPWFALSSDLQRNSVQYRNANQTKAFGPPKIIFRKKSADIKFNACCHSWLSVLLHTSVSSKETNL